MPDFDAVQTVTPVKPSRLRIVLTVEEAGDGTKDYEGTFNFVVPATDGRQIEQRHGDLVPHLTPGQRTALVNFMDTMLAKAQGVVG